MLRVGESNPALPRSIWIEESPLTGGYTDRYTNAQLDMKADKMTHTVYILLIQMIYFYHHLFFNVKNSFQTKYINHNHLLIFKGTEGNVVENGESSI